MPSSSRDLQKPRSTRSWPSFAKDGIEGVSVDYTGLVPLVYKARRTRCSTA